jgi:hypothetical protein
MEGLGEGLSSLFCWLARSVAWAVTWFEQDGAVHHGLIAWQQFSSMLHMKRRVRGLSDLGPYQR